MKKRLKKLAIDARALRDGRPRKTHLQVGALCYRQSEDGLQILLVTSRGTGRWIIPKGWPMRKLTAHEAAAREAYEEAGIRGTVSARGVGFYSYRKEVGRLFLPCLVHVFPLEVSHREETFPEMDERKARWFKPKKALKRVREPELRGLIRAFIDQNREESV